MCQAAGPLASAALQLSAYKVADLRGCVAEGLPHQALHERLVVEGERCGAALAAQLFQHLGTSLETTACLSRACKSSCMQVHVQRRLPFVRLCLISIVAAAAHKNLCYHELKL